MSQVREKIMSSEKISQSWFTEKIRGMKISDAEDVLKKSEEIKEKARGPLSRYFDDIRTLLGMVRDYVAGTYRETPRFTIASATFALLYIFVPVDLIPDFIPTAGLIDDASVFALCLNLIREDFAIYRKWKAGR